VVDLPPCHAAAPARRRRPPPDRVNIFLLTGGGPYTGSSSIAGSTDILISYTYKLAIATGKGQDYGLASAVAIIIFFIVATISGITFYRSKALENVT
jgi:arabinogalactan oligomer/maltooligosaccharide transport system permease protein